MYKYIRKGMKRKSQLTIARSPLVLGKGYGPWGVLDLKPEAQLRIVSGVLQNKGELIVALTVVAIEGAAMAQAVVMEP